MHSRRDSSAVLCRYFKQGHCFRGDSCYFSHDLSSQNVCRYFLQGNCAFGDRCRYDHVRPSKPDKDSVSTASPTRASFTSPVPVKSAWGDPSTAKTTSSQSPPSSSNSACASASRNPEDEPLCPYGVHSGECNVPDCAYLHGDMCDVCQLMILHPYNEQLRLDHKKMCEQQFEEDLHYSFAVEASKDKICGICLEVVLEKEPPSERKFGILDCCDHVFCLKCIMSWRQAGQAGPEMSKEAIKACPECRRTASFIMKSDFWCDTPEVKKNLEEKWKANAKKKPCKFWKSEGYCRFGNHCFFSHDGTPGQRRRRLHNDRGVIVDEDHTLDFVSLLLEATRRHGNVNPSSILFSLSDDDSDDISFGTADDYVLSSFANVDRASHIFLPEDGEDDFDVASETSGDNDWTSDDDDDDLPWLSELPASSTSNNNDNNTTHGNSPSGFNQPD